MKSLIDSNRDEQGSCKDKVSPAPKTPAPSDGFRLAKTQVYSDTLVMYRRRDRRRGRERERERIEIERASGIEW